VSHLLAVVLRIWVPRESLALNDPRFERSRSLLRAGIPYFGATASNLVALQFDTILVVSLLSTEGAGIYAVASAFANGQSSLGEALGITSFAVLSNESDAGLRGEIITSTFRQSALASCAAGLALAALIPLVAVPLFGRGFSRAIWPAIVLALAASLSASANILNQGLRGSGRPHAGVASQLFGTAVMGLAALLFLRPFGLIGVACAVWFSACAQVLMLVAAAAKWLNISPLKFWPFGSRTIRLFFQQLVSLRLRDSRSAA
jgi:O-antigen/teichoic acid export membrane protein